MNANYVFSTTLEAEFDGRSFCWLPVSRAAIEVPAPSWLATGIVQSVDGEECELFKHCARQAQLVADVDALTTAAVLERARRARFEAWCAIAP